jgi:hypothetical protein
LRQIQLFGEGTVRLLRRLCIAVIGCSGTGSIVIDVWKDTYGNFPPTALDTITGSEKPTISSGVKGQDLGLSTWGSGKNVTAGDTIRFHVDSCTAITKATLVLQAVK